MEDQGYKNYKQDINYPRFNFDDVLSLQCCMEIIKKTQGDKELYEQLQNLHDRVHDAYWLEKQGNIYIESKFKAGDWIVGNNTHDVYKVLCAIDDEYCISHNIDGNVVRAKAEGIDKKCHLWSIGDANDGDVLVFDDAFILIFKEKGDPYILFPTKKARGFNFKSHVFLDFLMNVFEQGSFCDYMGNKCHPATKEQRIALFAIMKEYGYEWDSEKKMLTKIEQKPVDNQFTPEQANVLDKYIDKFLEQKHTWSEEDEKIRKSLIGHLKECRNNTRSEVMVDEYANWISWLEKQGEQKSQGKSALEVWKDMRLEAYQQASGNRHEPNYSNDSTKMFSLTDINEIFEKVAEKQCNHNEQNFWEKCNHCEYFDGYDVCLHEKNFGSVTDESKENCKNNKFFIEKHIEPKFRIGDWVVYDGVTYLITEVYDKDGYTNDHQGFIPLEHQDEMRLWDFFEDAKNGDVLCAYSSDHDCVFLYQNTDEIEPDKNVAVAYCCIDVYEDKIEFGIQGPDCIDIRKIKPATKEQRNLLLQKMKEAGYEWNAENKELKKIEQNYAWSEEDVHNIQDIDSILFYDKNLPEDTRIRLRNWFESLEERYFKPTDEQIIALRWVLNNIPYCNHKEEISGLLDQLTSL